MRLKLYEIFSTVSNENAIVGFEKNGDEIFEFFKLNIGNEEKIKKYNLNFVADSGYTLKNIKTTDFLNCTYALLFSENFFKRTLGKLSKEIIFFPCKVLCEGFSLDWYAAQVVSFKSLIDEQSSVYTELTDGEKVLEFTSYRKDIEESFYIARDKDNPTVLAVSDLFVDLCKDENLQIDFKGENEWLINILHR